MGKFCNSPQYGVMIEENRLLVFGTDDDPIESDSLSTASETLKVVY